MAKAKCSLEIPRPELPEDIQHDLNTARREWSRAEYVVTPRVMAQVGIDAALDAMNEFYLLEEQHGQD